MTEPLQQWQKTKVRNRRRQALAALGIYPAAKDVPAAWAQALRTLHDDGWQTGAIGATTGLSRDLVRQDLNALGVTLRRGNPYKRSRRGKIVPPSQPAATTCRRCGPAARFLSIAAWRSFCRASQQADHDDCWTCRPPRRPTNVSLISPEELPV